MIAQLDQVRHRLSKARELLLRGEIEGEDYRTIKSEASERITEIEAMLQTSTSLSGNMELLSNLPISNISHLDELFQDGTVIHKRKIVSTLFPGILMLNDTKLLHTKVNTAITWLNGKNKIQRSDEIIVSTAPPANGVHLSRKQGLAAIRNRV